MLLFRFKSFCPCHSKNGLNSEFKPFFCYVYILVFSTFSTAFLPKNRMKCFKIHRFRRVHHQNSITFLGAKPAQKSADILIKTPQHLRMALRSFALRSGGVDLLSVGKQDRYCFYRVSCREYEADETGFSVLQARV